MNAKSLLALAGAVIFALTAFTGVGAHLISYSLPFLWIMLFVVVLLFAGFSFFGKDKERALSLSAVILLFMGVGHLILAASFGYEPFLIWPVR
ncbi:MAG TPA: hypothetical protein VH597_13895 [Verrucomicrobiae bacterium]|jgi:hypothetical protein|nr:hypothetical protein [Verrucomicrobiae bacterium]